MNILGMPSQPPRVLLFEFPVTHRALHRGTKDLIDKREKEREGEEECSSLSQFLSHKFSFSPLFPLSKGRMVVNLVQQRQKKKGEIRE